MSKKTNHQECRDLLLEGVVRAGSHYGFAGITNQIISELSGKPEAYIYRYFLDRNDLLEKAFLKCDENFFGKLTENLPLLLDSEGNAEERFARYMDTCWDYLAEDYDYCKFYVRYFYSNANTPELRKKHTENCQRFTERLKAFFREDEKTDKVMNLLISAVIWNVMDMAIGVSEDTKENRKLLFGFLFEIIAPYLKKTV